MRMLRDADRGINFAPRLSNLSPYPVFRGIDPHTTNVAYWGVEFAASDYRCWRSSMGAGCRLCGLFPEFESEVTLVSSLLRYAVIR